MNIHVLGPLGFHEEIKLGIQITHALYGLSREEIRNALEEAFIKITQGKATHIEFDNEFRTREDEMQKGFAKLLQED